MKTKKTIALIICAALLFSVAITGCGEKSKQSGSDDVGKQKGKTESKNDVQGDNNAENGMCTPGGTFPIAKEKVTFTVALQENPWAKDYETNDFTKEFEELTNIHLKWDILPQEGFKEQVNIMLSSMDLPDIFMDCGISSTQQMQFGKEGIFIALNDYIDKYGIETKKLFESKPWVKEVITMPDGNIYDLPRVNECYHCTMDHKLYMYKPWLDKLGLEIPKTTDDFYDVLKAFKENDPNGNGKKDEIPMSGSEKSWNADVRTFLMNAFIYNDGDRNMTVKDGKIEVAYNKPEWRDGLRYISKLYKEGLIATESFTQDGDQLLRMGTQMPNILGCAPGGSPGCITKALDEDPKRDFDFVTISPLEGPNGVKVATLAPYMLTAGVYIITNECEHPDVAFRMADALYNEDMSMRAVAGIEDVNWRKAKDGELNPFGEQAKWVYLPGPDDPNYVQNNHWDQRGPTFRSAEWRASWAIGENSVSQDYLDLYTKEVMETCKPSMETIVPPLVFDEKQSEELPTLEKTIKDFVTESTVRFITGDLDIEKDWDKYLKELDNMELKRYLNIYQKAYDAKQKALNK